MPTLDIISEVVWLLTLYPYDRNGAATVTVRVSNRDYVTLPTDTPASTFFDGFLVAFQIDRHLVSSGQIRSAQSQSFQATVRIANPTRDDGGAGRKLDAWLAYAWQGARWTLDALTAGDAFAAATRVFSGTVERPDEDSGDLLLTLHDRGAELAKDIQTNKYGGTGGFDGDASLAGKFKPLGFGLVRRVPGVFVDPALLWYDLNDGAISAILEVTDKGIALTADVSNPPASGKYYADLANGRVRLGASPVGEPRFSFRGDASGSGYVSTHADIMRRIVTTRGASPLSDPADIDTASVTQLNTDAPQEVGIWIGTDQTSIASVLDKLAGSLGSGWWIFNGSNQFSVGMIKPPTIVSAAGADLVLTEYEISLDTLKRVAVDVPPWQIQGSYAQYYGPLDRTSLGAITDAAKNDWAQPWRGPVLATNAGIQTAWPFSVALPVQHLVDTSSDAQALTNALGALVSADRRWYGPESGLQILTAPMHGQVWLSHAYTDLSAGYATRLLGYSGELVAGYITPDLFG